MDQLIIPALMHAGQYLVTLTLTALALFSVYSLSVIGERWWTFRQARTASDGLLASVLDEVGRGRLQEALTACKVGRGSYLAAVLAAGYKSKSKSFKLIVNQALAKNKRFKRVKKGVYALKG